MAHKNKCKFVIIKVVKTFIQSTITSILRDDDLILNFKLLADEIRYYPEDQMSYYF